MDKDLEDLQDFANDLNQIPEERPNSSARYSGRRNKIFNNGTKKINNKMKLMSSVSIALTTNDAKKN